MATAVHALAIQPRVVAQCRAMTTAVRIALANLAFPESPADSVARVESAIAGAAGNGASIVCFPECYVPGYRGTVRHIPPPDAGFLERAWRSAADAAAMHRITVILGTERIVDGAIRPTAVVIRDDGSIAGVQDKVQLDPSEDATYAPGSERSVFQTGPITFGVVICHEGWRYPETVRYAARRGAQIVFHPHLHEPEPGSYRPATFADAANTFHEKAAMCRAAENTCYFATVNYAIPGSATTSAVINPDGTVLAWHPYGVDGLLFADLDLERATGLLASRFRGVA
jgi:predicted amidohydrolase